jgi:hypothetical protein
MKIKLNQAGQVTVEYVLIAVVLLSVFLAVKNFIVSSNMLANYIQKPWDMVAGMMETGVWGNPAQVRSLHPGSLDRHNSFLGDRGT